MEHTSKKKEKIFVENGTVTAQTDWFRECHEKSWPYIEVKKRNKYADIHWDCISIDPSLDGAVLENEKVSAYIAGVFNAIAVERSSYMYSVFVGWFRNIPIDRVDAAARAIFMVLEREVREFRAREHA
jgi:hypothetical protein